LGFAELLSTIFSGRLNPCLPPERQIESAHLISTQGFPIDTARNDVCRMFLDEDSAEYLLFLDADMRHPGDLAHCLLRHGLPLVTGRYQMRKPPFHTCAMRKAGPGPHDFKSIEEQSGLVPVDRAGAGCLLIHRSVLEAIRARIGDDWFRYGVGKDGLRTVSEDFWFFEQAIAAGFQPFCDLDTVCTHVASFEIDPGWHQPYRQAFDEQQREQLQVPA
jgi:hypothetical protein